MTIIAEAAQTMMSKASLYPLGPKTLASLYGNIHRAHPIGGLTACGYSLDRLLRTSEDLSTITCPKCIEANPSLAQKSALEETAVLDARPVPLGTKTRRLAAMMVATMLAGSHHTEACVAEDKQITNAVRVALKIIRAVDEAA